MIAWLPKSAGPALLHEGGSLFYLRILTGFDGSYGYRDTGFRSIQRKEYPDGQNQFISRAEAEIKTTHITRAAFFLYNFIVISMLVRWTIAATNAAARIQT